MISNEFPLTYRGQIYECLPVHFLINIISKVSKNERNLLLRGKFLSQVKKNTYTLIVEKKT